MKFTVVEFRHYNNVPFYEIHYGNTMVCSLIPDAAVANWCCAAFNARNNYASIQRMADIIGVKKTANSEDIK